MGYLIKILLFFFLFLKLLCNSFELNAQNYSCDLYGSITTVDSVVYTGAIRWNNEEVFQTDFFNSRKESNAYLKYLDPLEHQKTRVKSRKNYWAGFKFVRESNDNDWQTKYSRKFQCRFGDIKSITVTGRESVDLELKTGKFIQLKGGSNDLGTQIWILDKELGLLKIDWERINVINFFTCSDNNCQYFGNPIYGKLISTKGEFVGFIQWDHDERLQTDFLDGRSVDGEVSIAFSNILSIQKLKEGCRVMLKSGRELDLIGKNDVNNNNRGVIVDIPGVGRVDFSWEHFLSLKLMPLPEKIAGCMDQFPNSQRLYGTVYSNAGRIYKGIIVYDLDEAMDSEILNGYNDKIEFFLPFRNIKIIEPKAFNYCMVELKTGQKLYLGDQADVSEQNAGILVFTGINEYSFLQWNEIKRIDFE
ncbi:hypothetical protein [Ancylomarina longa]|uniref:WG repeat-containing protein n=1 Tax=Ancylomarina longa TaxID=2487017 RepID=A0A434AGP6_9BACT|nr:hypothetical protein [Ancylomarina longa]RUT73564.1 hypothetical protein DLK05_12725 [Ancylomarina longa]